MNGSTTYIYIMKIHLQSTVSALIMRRSKIIIFATQRNIRNLVGKIATLNLKKCIIRNCARKVGYSANFGKVPSTLMKL